ncbi:MAG: EAL domain-containing protein [Acidobacteria bacterium]|jgi:EAL domain-containing protein (putative c-di-GMP-specific phosphodiesterase class I)|nr:MAG: EAL domain-containing protein [Acidobacteriota bacterium]
MEFNISLSLGYTLVRGRNPGFYQVYKECDIALYRGKGTTKNALILFRPQEEEQEHRKRQIVLGLKTAIERGEFFLVYQPIYDVELSQPIAYEALIRWYNKNLGLVSPGEFIPYAEATGLILELGRYVIDKAIKDSKRLNLPVHINLSARQLYDTSLPNYLESLTKMEELPPDKVVLEITESQDVLMDEYLTSQIKILQLMGFGVSLDDFGTGYSNIVLLNELRPKNLKIDMSIVRMLETPYEEKEAEAIIRAIVDIAKALTIDVVAEGVDSKLKKEKLYALGVNKMQGFYFGKPERLEVLLNLSNSS